MASKAEDLNQLKIDSKSECKNDKHSFSEDQQLNLLAEIIADFLFNEINRSHDKQFIERGITK